MGVIVTKLGLEKIAQATIDVPLKLEKFAVGDGGGYDITPNKDMTSLVNEKYRDFINGKYTDNNNTIFEIVLRANSDIKEGFYIRELGLFDEEGDLIVVTDVPLQYRPASEGSNIVAELLFNISIQLQNSDIINIKLSEQALATVDALQRLQAEFNSFKLSIDNVINSSLGIEKYFNTDNTYKDQEIIRLGVKTYGLAGSIVNIAEYPDAFENSHAVDRGDGTFQIPEIYDGTIRHLPKGNTRELGTFEADDFKSHGHDMTHDHDMSHQHWYSKYDNMRGNFYNGDY